MELFYVTVTVDVTVTVSAVDVTRFLTPPCLPVSSVVAALRLNRAGGSGGGRDGQRWPGRRGRGGPGAGGPTTTTLMTQAAVCWGHLTAW